MDSLNHNACMGENEVRTNNLKWKEKSSLDDGGHDCNWKNKFVPSDVPMEKVALLGAATDWFALSHISIIIST